MADTIAKLIFQADTSQLKNADKILKNITKSAKDAENVASKNNQTQKKSTKISKEEAQARKIANAVRKAEIKAYQENIKMMKRAEINAHKEAAARKKLTKTQQAATRLSKKETAIRRAEINAYRENIKRQKKLEGQTKKTSNANEKLSNSFRNASNASATLLGPLNPISGRLSFIATGLQRVGIGGVALGFVMAKLTQEIVQGIRAFADLESQMFKIEGILRATGNSVGFTSEEINDMAIALGENTLASANGARDAAAQLMVFQSVQGETFREALDQAQNLTTITGRGLSSSVQNLGRLLENPVDNFNSLTRAGIRFNAEEKDIIKSLTIANKKLEAQDFILKKLGISLGEAGKEAALGLGGLFDTFGEQLVIFSQKIGALAVKFLPIETAMKTMIDALKDLNAFLDRLEKRKTLGQEGMASGALIGSAFGFKGAAIGGLIGGVSGLFVDEPTRKNVGEKRNKLSEITGRANTPENSGFRFFDDPGVKVDAKTKPEALGNPLDDLDVQSQRMLQFQEEEKAALIERLDARKSFEDHNALMHQEAAELRAQLAIEEINREHEERVAKEELRVGEHDREIEALEELRNRRLEVVGAQYESELNAKQEFQSSLGRIDAKGSLARAKFEQKTQLAQTKQFVGQLSNRLSAAAGLNKAMFRISQAAAVAETVVNTYEAVQLARSSYPPPFNSVMAAAELAAGMGNLAAIKAQSFGGGGSLSGGGGGATASSVASSAPVQIDTTESVSVQEPSIVNVTVDGTIDPSGARRIIEAINEATEDGLEINAMVGS